jgi:hypothetical protein
MKRILFIPIICILLACGSSQRAVKEVERTLKGEWTVESVDIDTELPLSIKLFNDAGLDCFTGSNWKFVANNNSGKYKLSGFDCDHEERYFIFTVEKMNDGISGDILLKPVDAKGDSQNNNKGFRITVNYLDDNTMTWRQYVNYGGRRISIDMNFKSTQL